MKTLCLLLLVLLIPANSFAQQTVRSVYDVNGDESVSVADVTSLTERLLGKTEDVLVSVSPVSSSTNPCDYDGDEICVFKHILVAGDSFGEGVFNTFSGNGYFTDAEYSFPAYLAKITGCKIDNRSFEGVTTAGWYDKMKDEDLSGHDCAIIQLGLNDKNVASEAVVTEPLEKIVEKLQAENNRIKIFIATTVPTQFYKASYFVATNSAIRNFCNSRTDLYLVDLYRYG